MARRSTKAAATEETAVAAAETTAETAAEETIVETKQERKFPLSRLAAHCQKLFGVPSSTFAGATAGLEDGEYSKSEIEAVISEWKGKEAK